jgi:gamma-glutamylcyclotransferase (GGCT)/AIG2-like uncharacterized protein YtfP
VERLFVYGTLRREGTARHFLRESTFVGPASIRGSVIQQHDYLGLIPGDMLVPGELYEISEELFSRLDAYEGSGYARRLTEIEYAGEKITAWVYWLA